MTVNRKKKNGKVAPMRSTKSGDKHEKVQNVNVSCCSLCPAIKKRYTLEYHRFETKVLFQVINLGSSVHVSVQR